MAASKLHPLQGTLGLMVPQTRDTMGPLHVYGIARDSRFARAVTATRLDQSRIVISDQNRMAKLYTITKTGKRQRKEDRSYWERLAAVIIRVLAPGKNS